MNAIFQDIQDDQNKRNGTTISDSDSLHELFRSFRGREPFIFLLIGDNNTLTIGFSNKCGSVECSSSEGLPPYMMAVSDDVDEGKFVEFLAGGTPTPIPQRFCLSIDRLQKVIQDFLVYGGKSDAVEWEEI